MHLIKNIFQKKKKKKKKRKKKQQNKTKLGLLVDVVHKRSPYKM